MTRPTAIGILLLGAVTLSACYRFARTDLNQVAPGENIRVQLSEMGYRQLQESVGTDGYGVRERTVAGQVIRNDARDLELLVPWVPGEGTAATPTLNQRISLPRDGVLWAEARELNRGKTAAVVGALALGSAALLIEVFTGWVGSSPERGGIAPSESRAGVFLLRF